MGKEGAKSPAESSCAKALVGREARTIKSTGRLAFNDQERCLLDLCILRTGTFMLKAARNQSGGAGAGIIG